MGLGEDTKKKYKKTQNEMTSLEKYRSGESPYQILNEGWLRKPRGAPSRRVKILERTRGVLNETVAHARKRNGRARKWTEQNYLATGSSSKKKDGTSGTLESAELRKKCISDLKSFST